MVRKYRRKTKFNFELKTFPFCMSLFILTVSGVIARSSVSYEHIPPFFKLYFDNLYVKNIPKYNV
jgi:hypothetical protein